MGWAHLILMIQCNGNPALINGCSYHRADHLRRSGNGPVSGAKPDLNTTFRKAQRGQ
jgi:hypothetical protein